MKYVSRINNVCRETRSLTVSKYCMECPPNNMEENRRPISPNQPESVTNGRQTTEWRPPTLLVSMSNSVAVVVANINPIELIRLMVSHSCPWKKETKGGKQTNNHNLRIAFCARISEILYLQISVTLYANSFITYIWPISNQSFGRYNDTGNDLLRQKCRFSLTGRKN